MIGVEVIEVSGVDYTSEDFNIEFCRMKKYPFLGLLLYLWSTRVVSESAEKPLPKKGFSRMNVGRVVWYTIDHSPSTGTTSPR